MNEIYFKMYSATVYEISRLEGSREPSDIFLLTVQYNFTMIVESILEHFYCEDIMIQGDRLRDVRQQRGLSQAALGQRVGLDGQYIHKLEHGVLRSMTTTTLERLVHALHVSGDYLLGLSDQALWTPSDRATLPPVPDTRHVRRAPRSGPRAGVNGAQAASHGAAEVGTPAAPGTPAPSRSPAMCPHCYTPMVPMDDGQGLVCPGCRYQRLGDT